MLRSLLFAAAFYGWSALLSPFYVPLMLLPRGLFWTVTRAWAASGLHIARAVLGIRYELRGLENLPPGAAIFASKHQSAFDTLVFNVILPDVAYVLKRELFWVPFFGWFLWRVGMIGIDRRGGARSLKTMVAETRRALADGRSVVIFPQGTRTAPGVERPYLPGVAALYQQSGATVVPVALNSGLFWPRRRFVKEPGVITIEFLPPIAPGLARREFLKTLAERIEPATARLEAEARQRFPHLLPPPAPGGEGAPARDDPVDRSAGNRG